MRLEPSRSHPLTPDQLVDLVALSPDLPFSKRVLPHGGLRPSHQRSTCTTQLTLWSNLVTLRSQFRAQIYPRKEAVTDELVQCILKTAQFGRILCVSSTRPCLTILLVSRNDAFSSARHTRVCLIASQIYPRKESYHKGDCDPFNKSQLAPRN